MNTDDKILLAIKRIEKRLESTATKEDIKRVEQKVDTLELHGVVIHDENKKEHSQIMDMLVDSNEINYHALKKDIADLKKRMEQLEGKRHN